MNEVPYSQLRSADLTVDTVYEGGTAGNRGDDPIAKLLKVGNSGGFRFMGSPTRGEVKCLVLYTSGSDPDWPDRLDLTDGTFTYYGDNKHAGRELHETPRKGNLALRDMFNAAQTAEGRQGVPPIFLFAKDVKGADARFQGLLVPGSPLVPVDEQLVAIWRSAGDQRFQNYRAVFSVLDVGRIPRDWLSAIERGEPEVAAPKEWLAWRQTGVPKRLLAPRSLTFRTREQQLPTSKADLAVLAAIHGHFAADPYEFENFAAQIWMMLATATDELGVTRRSRDGGRDALGTYRIGPPGDPIRIEFALEAKCYAPHQSVGVKEMSRLISRLRHRQFGVLVTTSFVGRQAYQEIREDRHPVAVVSGSDIVELLKARGKPNVESVSAWLRQDFPIADIVSAPTGIEIEFEPHALDADVVGSKVDK